MVPCPQGEVPMEQCQLEGKELSFAFTLNQGQFKVKLSLDEENLKGTFTSPDGASGTLLATRAPAAAESLTGAWNITARDSEGKEHKLRMSLKEEEGSLKGYFILPEGETIPVAELKKEGTELSFKVNSRNSVFHVKLTLAGTSLKGSYSGANGETGQVEATR